MTPWNPQPIESADTITAAPAEALAGLLDTEAPGEELPVLWHWLFHLERHPQSALGPDGHPRDGHFLPPLPDRRRMFAGARLRSAGPFRIGDEIVRRSSLAAVQSKKGRTGDLLFTTVRHEFRRGTDLLAVEEQDLVYRSGDAEPTGLPPVPQAPGLLEHPAPCELRLVADPVLLFRFSALTYNAHRIHYDHAYATGTEGHRGLVVHGPLLAILAAEPARRAGRRLRSVEFRARRPVYAGWTATVRSDENGANLTTPDGETALTMMFPANATEPACIT